MAKEVKKVTVKLLDGAKAIDKAIASISTRGKSLQRDIHIAAVSCLNHADKHGDITLAQKLIDAIPTLARKNALRDWFIAFGKFGYDEKSKLMTYNKKGATLLQEAMDMPFWDFQPEKAYVPFDIKAQLENILKRANSAIERGEKVDSKVLEAVQKLVA